MNLIPNKILEKDRNNELIKLYSNKYGYNKQEYGIQLKENKETGELGVYSIKKFKKGDIIISNIEPYVWAVTQHNIVCDYCLKNKYDDSNLSSKIQLKRCTNCKLIYYCSTECQKKAWSIHKHECKILLSASQESIKLNKPINTKSTVMLLRIFIKRFLELQQQQSSPSLSSSLTTTTTTTTNIDKSGQFEIIDYLLNHKEKRIKDNDEKSNNYKSFSIGFCSQLKENLNLSPIVLEYLLKLEPNSINIPKCEAIGLYPLMVFFNHSCRSNLSILNDKKELKIICNRDIDENEELFINYSPSICYSNERREILKDNFYFNCHCELCKIQLEQNPPDEIDLHILCKNCKNSKINIIKKKCFQCNENYSTDQLLKNRSIVSKIQKNLNLFLMNDQDYNNNNNNNNSNGEEKINISEFKLLINQYCKEFYYTDPLFYEIVNKTDLFYQDFSKDIQQSPSTMSQLKHYHSRYQSLLKYHLFDSQNLPYEYCRQLIDYLNSLIQIGYFKDSLNILNILNQILSNINYYGFNKDYLISIKSELEFNINLNHYK